MMEGEGAETIVRPNYFKHTLRENSTNTRKDAAIKTKQSLHSLEADSKLQL